MQRAAARGVGEVHDALAEGRSDVGGRLAVAAERRVEGSGRREPRDRELLGVVRTARAADVDATVRVDQHRERVVRLAGHHAGTSPAHRRRTSCRAGLRLCSGRPRTERDWSRSTHSPRRRCDWRSRPPPLSRPRRSCRGTTSRPCRSRRTRYQPTVVLVAHHRETVRAVDDCGPGRRRSCRHW